MSPSKQPDYESSNNKGGYSKRVKGRRVASKDLHDENEHSDSGKASEKPATKRSTIGFNTKKLAEVSDIAHQPPEREFGKVLATPPNDFADELRATRPPALPS